MRGLKQTFAPHVGNMQTSKQRKNKFIDMKNTIEINWKDGTTTKEVDGKIVTTRYEKEND